MEFRGLAVAIGEMQKLAARPRIDQLAVSVSWDYLGQRFLRGAGRHMRVVV